MIKSIVHSAACIMATCLANQAIQASSLKVYNMHRYVFNGRTSPSSDCGNGRDYCSIIPYQSFFTTNSVIFNLPNQHMDYFYWCGIVGPQYKIEVNLDKDEHATLELYADGGYKFKNRLIEYAQEI